jgi:hypothetical protein
MSVSISSGAMAFAVMREDVPLFVELGRAGDAEVGGYAALELSSTRIFV